MKKLAECYKKKIPITLIDDANFGIDPNDDTILAMGLKAKLTIADWVAVGVALGLSAAGMTVIVLACIDPEPTTKLGLLIGSGAICLIGGGFSAISILTKRNLQK
ncbi:MAG: hypothetical protein HC831_18745 [Chloroflexia bacterium]|nr:hypothetical protein [Chloroflexia bacterium]